MTGSLLGGQIEYMGVMMFNLLLIAICGYAFVLGGTPERIVATTYLGAAGISRLLWIKSANPFQSIEWGFFAVDVAVLTILIAVVVKADRFWTMYAAAFQLIETGIHLVKMLQPDLLAWAYAVSVIVASYPMLMLLACGTWRYQRRLRVNSVDIY